MRSALALTALGLITALSLSSCACGATSVDETTPVHASEAPPHSPPPPTAREGITIERVAGPPHEQPGDGLITLVRFDLSRFRLTLITEMENEATWRTLPEWAAREHLVAGINAAMFEENGRASGLLVDDGVERAIDDPRFGGVLAFDPIDPSDAPFVMIGRDCPTSHAERPDLASLRARYRSLVANYRMLDCDGSAIAWVDESTYSSAAFARDRDGRFVLIHAETEYRMRDLATVLANPALGLTDIHYVEGGPKASVWLDDGTGAISLVGSRHEDDGTMSDRGPRPIPNVLGVLPR